MGKAFLAGLVFAILLIPINRWLAIKIGKLSTEMMEQKDARVQLMSEILHGIRVIKLSAWESIFTGKINTLRCVFVCVCCVCVRDATIYILGVSMYHLFCITIQRYIA